jgi:hypothetical protein
MGAVAELSARVSRARERSRGSIEGAYERGEVGEQGGAQKGHEREDVAGERANVGASTAGRSWARG